MAQYRLSYGFEWEGIVPFGAKVSHRGMVQNVFGYLSQVPNENIIMGDWNVTADMSVGSRRRDNNVEIVSPVFASRESMVDAFSLMAKYCRNLGIQAHRSGGIHVHVGRLSVEPARYLRPLSDRNGFPALALARQWALKEEEMFAQFRPWPERALFIGGWRTEFIEYLTELAEQASSLTAGDLYNRLMWGWYGIHRGTSAPAPRAYWAQEYNERAGRHYDPSRYMACNLDALTQHHTVEFRLFNGTLRPDQFQQYAQAVEDLVHTAWAEYLTPVATAL